MATRHRPSKVARILTLIGALVVVFAGIHAAKTIIVRFLIALFIAIISASPLYWLKEKKFPPWLALVVVIMGILSFGLVIAGIIGSSVSDFSNKLPFYEARLKQQTASILSWMARLDVDVSRLELEHIVRISISVTAAHILIDNVLDF